jgi:ribonuclease HI
MRKTYNPKVVRIMNQIHREKEHLIIMWVPEHAGIQGNEKAGQGHCKEKPTRTTKPLQNTGKTG